MLFRKPHTKDGTLKLFFAADIHGSEKCFGKFLNAAKFFDVDLLILGGDITGKALVLIVDRHDGTFETNFLGREAIAHSEEELTAIEKRIRFNGLYPYRCSVDDLADLQRDNIRRDRIFESVMKRDTEHWMDMVGSRLEGSGVRCLAMPGNDDRQFISDIISDANFIENCDENIIEVAGYQVLSLGYSNPTPWNSPRELGEAEITARIDRLAHDRDSSMPLILNLHTPPYGSGLDNAPAIREDLSLIGGANARMVPVGSTAVRSAIETYAPLLSLHGHIHESRAAAKIGRCISLNPGSEYNVGVLRGVIVTLTPERVVGHQFVAV